MADIPEPIAAILPALVADLEATLADDLLAIWLYGSAVLGGFDAASSDLDLVVATETDAAALDLERLDGVHRRLAAREPEWADRIDIAYVSRATLGSFRAGGAVASISHDEPLQVYDEADAWLQTWYLAREADVTVFGPSAREMIPDITAGEFATAVARNANELIVMAQTDRRPGFQAYLLLTLPRVLLAVERHDVVPKQLAAAEVIRRWPEWQPLLVEALAVRAARGRRALSPGAVASVPAYLEAMAAEISAARCCQPNPAASASRSA